MMNDKEKGSCIKNVIVIDGIVNYGYLIAT